jgi:hypothetical protein
MAEIGVRDAAAPRGSTKAASAACQTVAALGEDALNGSSVGERRLSDAKTKARAMGEREEGSGEVIIGAVAGPPKRFKSGGGGGNEAEAP